MEKMVKKSEGVLKRFYSQALFVFLSFVFIFGCAHNESKPKQGCVPKTVYGPPPCHSDEQCIQMEGEGWYCNRNHSFGDNGCGQEMIWPMCAPRK